MPRVLACNRGFAVRGQGKEEEEGVIPVHALSRLVFWGKKHPKVLISVLCFCGVRGMYFDSCLSLLLY